MHCTYLHFYNMYIANRIGKHGFHILLKEVSIYEERIRNSFFASRNMTHYECTSMSRYTWTVRMSRVVLKSSWAHIQTSTLVKCRKLKLIKTLNNLGKTLPGSFHLLCTTVIGDARCFNNEKGNLTPVATFWRFDTVGQLVVLAVDLWAQIESQIQIYNRFEH